LSCAMIMMMRSRCGPNITHLIFIVGL